MGREMLGAIRFRSDLAASSVEGTRPAQLLKRARHEKNAQRVQGLFGKGELFVFTRSTSFGRSSVRRYFA